MNEQKISALEKMYLEHDEKFENIVKLIRLLQAFAETQVTNLINSGLRKYQYQVAYSFPSVPDL
jgi:hypothetical protein